MKAYDDPKNIEFRKRETKEIGSERGEQELLLVPKLHSRTDTKSPKHPALRGLGSPHFGFQRFALLLDMCPKTSCKPALKT